MRRRPITLAMAVLIIMVCGIRLPSSFADSAGNGNEDAAAVSIPVTVEREGNKGSDDVVYILTAESPDCPMPEGSDGNMKTAAEESGRVDFGDIKISRPGAYFYEISRQYTDTASATHDDREYRVLVAKMNGGETLLVSWDCESEEKTDGVVFKDKYTDGSGPKTGDDSGIIYAAAIFASMLAGLLMIITRRKNEK